MSPQQAPPWPQGVSRSRRCREPRTEDDAAGGMHAGSPQPRCLSLPSPCRTHRGSPREVRRCPLVPGPSGASSVLHTSGRGDRLSAAAQAGWEPLPRTSGCQSLPLLQLQPPVTSLTVTFHPLVNEPVQQRPAVVTEGGAGVRVDFKFVFAPGILGENKR